jgi:DNA repair protein RadD
VVSLRPYQQVGVDAVRAAYAAGKRAPLAVMPTGAGKTVLFSFITQNAAARGKRVVILAHRAELIEQIAGALEQFGVAHGFVAAGYPYVESPVLVASAQTLVKRLGKIPAPDLIVCDEAHHCVAGNTWGKILAAYPEAKVLGVTATARRPSGEALGDIFDSLVMGPSLQELTDAGFLVPARIFAPPTVDTSGLHVRAGEFVPSEVKERMKKPTVVGDAISHYRKLAPGKKAVCFCYSVEHSQAMAAAFREAGFSAIHMDGGLDRAIRRDMVRDFRQGRITVVCSVDILGEGFDLPGIEVGILLRPTASEIVYLQQIGRCLRTTEGKTEALILDHVGNVERHGLPNEDREWTLEGRAKRVRKDGAAGINVRICSTCFAAHRAGPLRCATCGAPYPVESREVLHQEGELVEVKARARREQGRARTLDELIAFGKSKGYGPGWAHIVWKSRQQKQGAA